MSISKYKQGQVVIFTPASHNPPGHPKTIESVEVHNGIYFYRLLGITGLFVASSIEPYINQQSGEEDAVDA